MKCFCTSKAGSHIAVDSAPDSIARGPGFNTLSDHILSFLLLLVQEGHLSGTGESMCMKYWARLFKTNDVIS